MHYSLARKETSLSSSRTTGKSCLMACAIAIGTALGASGAAASESERLMQILVQKGILSAEEAETIRAEATQEGQAELQETQVEKRELLGTGLGYEPTMPVRDDKPLIQTFPFAVQSADGKDIFRIRGRLQMDGGWQDFGSGIPDVARQGSDFPDYGVILRRLRLGALGVFKENWEWQLEVDFADNEVDLANAYIAYLMPHGRLAAGHFKEPFTMEYATSSRYITFMERSTAVDAYKVDRQPGIMYETIKPNWYGALGVFGNGIEINRDVEEGWSVGGRASFAPYLQGTDFIHIGGGFNYRENGENQSVSAIGSNGRYEAEVYKYPDVRLRTREGTRVIDARLIGRDDLNAIEDVTRYGLEFAAGKGSWWMQSEYIRVDLDVDTDELGLILSSSNKTDKSSLTQDGWYVQTGYFLTGESKPYRAFSGDYARLRPIQNFSSSDGGLGALEVAFRYSVADSLEHTRIGRGQKLETWTAGLNWYLNPEVLIRANVIYLEGERDIYKDDGWMYAFRLQYLF